MYVAIHAAEPAMADPRSTPPVALEQVRERTIADLCQHFAADHLGDAELERRLDQAHRAATLADLRGLVADLPALRPAGAPAPAPGVGLARPENVADTQTIVAIMGGAVRRGQWTPPRNLNVFAVMGGAELDFRDAAMAPGVTEVNVFALMGGVEITVPPGLTVEVNGIAIMGGFDHRASTPPPSDPSAPVLRIGGFAMMGGVEIKARYPGEKDRDARRRERDERRELRREVRRIRRGDERDW
jgi:hypothetical protein